LTFAELLFGETLFDDSILLPYSLMYLLTIGYVSLSPAGIKSGGGEEAVGLGLSIPCRSRSFRQLM